MRAEKELNEPTSCLNKAFPQEMVFVLLGRDPAAPYAIRNWTARRIALGKNKSSDEQLKEALVCADTMEVQAEQPTALEMLRNTEPTESMRNLMLMRAGTDLMALCHGASKRAGWWTNLQTGMPTVNEPRIVAEKLMLIVSEIAEGMEGDRKNKADEHLPHRLSLEVELADAVIRIADLAGALNLDLGGAIAEKMAYNARRPDHKLDARKADNGKKY